MSQTYISKLIQLITLCAAIAREKKKLKSKFINEDKYIQFMKLAARLLDEHTYQLANAMQLVIVEWLRTEGENAAASWFKRYWTGVRGNYTTPIHQPVTAAKTTLRASNQDGLIHNVCGCWNQPVVAAQGFFPSLLTYCKTSSALHMGKLVKTNGGSCTHFQVKQTILPDMWKAAQRMDSRTYILAVPHRVQLQSSASIQENANEIVVCCREKTPLHGTSRQVLEKICLCLVTCIQ